MKSSRNDFHGRAYSREYEFSSPSRCAHEVRNALSRRGETADDLSAELAF